MAPAFCPVSSSDRAIWLLDKFAVVLDTHQQKFLDFLRSLREQQRRQHCRINHTMDWTMMRARAYVVRLPSAQAASVALRDKEDKFLISHL